MIEEMPKVSVVCAWYNRADYIHETIDSLLAQDYPNFDITIVNDGSPDPRVSEILNSYKDQRIRVIHQENSGFTRAIRKAIEECDGDYIAIQGAGDISHPSRISEQIKLFLKNPGASIVGAGCIQTPASGRLFRRKFIPEPNISENKLMKNMPFVHGTSLISRAAYNVVGGYDLRFKYCADWDLFFRLLRVGEIISINKQLYHQIMFPDGFSFSPQHKFKQIWFRERATDRSLNSRALLDSADLEIGKIDAINFEYFHYTLKIAIKCFAKGDMKNSIQWFRLAKSQLMRRLKIIN